jgi:hypothetical protein
MANKTMNAPLAIIKVKGVAVGLMKNIRINETIRRGSVKGIGTLIPIELPALDWTGELSCSFYMIDLNLTGLPGGINRNAPTVQDWVDNVLLTEQAVDVVIYKKVPKAFDPVTLLTSADVKPFATIRGCFADSDSFDISESQISGRDQRFSYLTPVLSKV